MMYERCVVSRALLRILACAYASPNGVSVKELMRCSGLYTTYRRYLDMLVEAGVIEVDTQYSGRPGRPRRVARASVPPEEAVDKLLGYLREKFAKILEEEVEQARRVLSGVGSSSHELKAVGEEPGTSAD